MGERVLVTGGRGFLGRHLSRAFLDAGWDVCSLARTVAADPGQVRDVTADLADRQAVLAAVTEYNPGVIVHAAARIDVDGCERQWRDAWTVNVEGTVNVLRAAESTGARVVYVSTDAVFDGRRGWYAEDDAPNPLNVYARTKLAGEMAVQTASPHHLVLRTNFFGYAPDRGNLATWMLTELAAGRTVPAFADVRFSALDAATLATFVLRALESGIEGVYHVGASDGCSKYDFARYLAAAFGYEASLVARSSVADAQFDAPRPNDTTLRSERFAAAAGVSLPTMAAAVATFAARNPEFNAPTRSRT